MALQTELITIERTLWRNDADTYERVFLPTAVLVFPETGRLDRAAAVQAIREENRAKKAWESVEFADEKVSELSSDFALLTYRAEARWNDMEEPVRVYCSTLYILEASGWRVALHQQSPVESAS